MVEKILNKYLCESVKKKLQNITFKDLQEIRLRVNKPIIIKTKQKEYVFEKVTKEELKIITQKLSEFSLYAFSEQLKNGFITIEGGHRVGIGGSVIVENGKVKGISHISSINIRISHEIIGCSKVVMEKLEEINHTLIISPPLCGKTTLLRDMVRVISDEYGKTVGVVDERGEIGGSYKGIPQKNIGNKTDILDKCPKAEGMIMMLRSLSPDVIAVDEIGSKKDVEAIEEILNCGIKIICTVHSDNFEELLKKPYLKDLIKTGIFENYILLSRPVGSIKFYSHDFVKKEFLK